MDIITISEQLKIPPSTTLSLCRKLSIPIFCQTTIECPSFGLDDHIGKEEEFSPDFMKTVENLKKYSSDFSNQWRKLEGRHYVGSIYINQTNEGVSRKFFTFKLDKLPQKALTKIHVSNEFIDLFINNSKTVFDTFGDYRCLYIEIEDTKIRCTTEYNLSIENFYIEEDHFSEIKNHIKRNDGFKSLQKNKIHVKLTQTSCQIFERVDSPFPASSQHTQNVLGALIEQLEKDNECEGAKLCELNTILSLKNCNTKSYEMLRSKNAAIELRHIIFQIEINGKKHISFRGKDDPENYPWYHP